MTDSMTAFEQTSLSDHGEASASPPYDQPKPDVVLPNDYALVLLRKLAGDDAFRAHYQSNPAQALRDIGVKEELLARVPAENLRPIKKLADKSVFHEALSSLIDGELCILLCLHQPIIKFFSSATKGRKSATTSFEAS